MILFFILIIAEILTFIVIRHHFYDKSWMRYFFLTLFNTAISIWLWIVWISIVLFRGFYDDPKHISLLMSLNGLLCAVVLPRFLIIIFHFAGKIQKRNTGGHNRKLTNTGLILAILIFLTVAYGNLFGRFNFKTEKYTIGINDLHKDLEGFKIVHISDIHLPSFYHDKNLLVKLMEQISILEPDMIINTGDFITYGWREFENSDTIFRLAKSKYGNFAVMGNHDFGTYNPFFTEADKKNNVLIMNRKITSSGYTVLNDEFTTIDIGDARIAVAGVITMGSFPEIIHGDLNKAINGIDSTDFIILLAHDPNLWKDKVKDTEKINLTLAGHTHGFQIGVITKKYSWSPARYFYPYWNGLYSNDDKYIVVNRGMGVLGIPVRIGMPPEISLITLKSQ